MLHAPTGHVRDDLRNLLRFAEELLATREKVIFDIADYPIRLTERDLRGGDGAILPGIAFSPAEDIWISFARLQERPPPPPPASLVPWLRAEARPSPASPPCLVAERVVVVSAAEASRLVADGLAVRHLISPLAGQPDRWTVKLRPAELPAICDALDAYVNGAWRAWAAEEAPRRAAIGLYETLYKAQAEIAAGGNEGGLELVFGIGMARWVCDGRRVHVPVIEQRAEFELDADTGTLSIIPRNVSPSPALRPFQELGIARATELQRDLTLLLERRARDPETAFGPFQPASFRDVLATCASALDASGALLDAAAAPPPFSGALRVTTGFCVIVRGRRDDLLRDDIRHLADAVANEDINLPETARRFVVPPPNVLPDEIGPINLDQLASGTASTASGWDPGPEPTARKREWQFFPLPANEEQAEIARRLERRDVYGIVVQGPPGTGKTHTIANIIGHWMAMGRRVLVSAHTAEALVAIRDMLPPALRDLAIAVIHSDREGARQLEEAVAALADRVQALDARAALREAEGLLVAIQRDDTRMVEIDAALADIARANLTEVPWRGGSALPRTIAAWVATQGDAHGWFTDRLDLTEEFEPRLSDSEITEARTLRARLGEDVIYHHDTLPVGSSELPSVSDIIQVHRALAGARERRERERQGNLPRPDFSVAQPGEPADLLAWLERLATWRDNCGDHAWLPRTWEALATEKPIGRLDPAALYAMLEEAAQLSGRGEVLALLALELDEVQEEERLADALARLSAGRPAFGAFSRFGRSPVRDAVERARVAGAAPSDASAWAKLAELFAWRQNVRGYVARWNALAARHGLTQFPEDHAAARDALARMGTRAAEMLDLLDEAHERLARLRLLFPYGLDAEAVVLRIEVSQAIEALRASRGDADIAVAEQVRATLQATGRRTGGAFGDALKQIAEGLGSSGIADMDLVDRWRAVQQQADRLAAQRDALRRLAAFARHVRDCGAKGWAEAITHTPARGGDPVLPKTWRDAWDHARATGFLARVVDRSRVQALTQERADLVRTREHHFRRAIELLTYLQLRQRLTEPVQTALRQFLAALARLPKTPGAKTAVRQRRILRDSLQRAARAVPCWIMPEWRVAEQLPAEIGSFDLVIIDEASQSNILALPVILRGKKLLIVGDDRQVSPNAVGIEHAAVTRLRNTHLLGQPLADQIDPGTSLYELGGMMYPSKIVVLREHFRCVEPIIRFSSRFYRTGGGESLLVPLRLPRPSERIEPPLVDIFVEDGERRGDVNEAEASVVVDEIRAVIADRTLHANGPRSIGVISLHANRQAKLIYDRLMQTIGPRAISDHRIMCGDAATFQGQERDIVFLSMVHDSRTAARQSSRAYEQRYNVALSRARDRLVLVRSVPQSRLKEGDIKLAVLRHFADPMAGATAARSDDVLAACESTFERDVGRRLLQAGFRVRAQVPAGGHRIDFVVEGRGDNRLAIELDGDSSQTPDRWAEDMRRQKALERVGWTFWRCWAAEWYADKDATFRELLIALEQRGIAPLGAWSDADAVAVASRTVRHRPAAAGVAPMPEESSLFADRKVGVGDTVVVRLTDGQDRRLTVTIVADGPADGESRIAATSPLALAILGTRIEDEVEAMIGGRQRMVIVEEIRDGG